MGTAPRSMGPTKGPTFKLVMALLLLVLVMVVQTNTQELHGPANRIIMMLKESMVEVKNEIVTMQTNLMEIKEEIKAIKQFNNMPVTAIEQKTNENMICPDFFIPINKTGECFLYSRQEIPYEEANRRCTSIGGNLAIPRNYKSLAFITTPQSPPIPQELWIGLNDKLTPNNWRWIDGTPINNLYALDSLNGTYSSGLPAKPGFNCGVLKKEGWGGPGEPVKFSLGGERCDKEGKGPGYLCEIKPRNTPFDIDVSPALCPTGFSVLPFTQECVYVSTEEEFTSYLEAEEICSSLGAKLAEPMDIEILSNHLSNQNFVGELGFWLHIEYFNYYPHMFRSWNNTAPAILLEASESMFSYEKWLDTGYCPLLKAGSLPFDWDNGDYDECESSHRFICIVVD